MLKFCSVHAKKTHQTGHESLLPERVQNRLHMRVAGADDTKTVYDADVRVDPTSSDCHPPGLTVAGRVIIDLVNALENKGHIIYCDNYYTSPALVAKLCKLGFGWCGTVRYTTQGILHAANPRRHNMKKGDDPKFFVKGGQMCIVWQDKKICIKH